VCFPSRSGGESERRGRGKGSENGSRTLPLTEGEGVRETSVVHSAHDRGGKTKNEEGDKRTICRVIPTFAHRWINGSGRREKVRGGTVLNPTCGTKKGRKKKGNENAISFHLSCNETKKKNSKGGPLKSACFRDRAGERKKEQKRLPPLKRKRKNVQGMRYFSTAVLQRGEGKGGGKKGGMRGGRVWYAFSLSLSRASQKNEKKE